MISRISNSLAQRSEWIALGVACLFTPFFYLASLPPFSVNEGAFVFLVPFFIWLNFRPSLKAVFWLNLAIWWLSWIVLIFWLRHVTWAGMFLLSGVMALHFSIWGFVSAWLLKRAEGEGLFRGIAPAIGIAALWVIIEHIRGIIFTGFPWLPLASSQADEPIMLQSASIFGSWSVSFGLVLLNFGIAAYLLRLVDYARKRKRSLCPEFYVAMLYIVGISFMLFNLSSGQQREESFRALVVQPDIPQSEKWDAGFERKILSDLERLTLAFGNSNPDAVFWPETVLPYALNDGGAMEAWTTRLATQLGKPIFAGALGIEEEGGARSWFNSVFLVRPEYGLFPLYYSKMHLVPFGEYIPLRRFWPWMEKVVPIEGDILPGEKGQLLPLDLEDTTLRVGSLICFEDVFPDLARERVKDGASLLYVATNSAWYGRSGAAAQHRVHSVLRAIETRRPVIRVGNDGWTGWIDEYGSVRDGLSPWERSSSIFKISRDRRWVGKQTFYVRYGDWFVWLCWGVFAFCVWAAPKMVDRESAGGV